MTPVFWLTLRLLKTNASSSRKRNACVWKTRGRSGLSRRKTSGQGSRRHELPKKRTERELKPRPRSSSGSRKRRERVLRKRREKRARPKRGYWKNSVLKLHVSN